MKSTSIGEERADRGSEASVSARASGAMEIDGGVLVGSFVGKEVSGPRKVLLGKVASYDGGRRIYGVVYEDGYREDLEHRQVCEILMAADDAGISSLKLTCRKRRLDQLVSSGGAGDSKTPPPNKRARRNATDASETSSLSRLGSDLSEDADSSSNSCDYARASASDSSPEVQNLLLPLSSGDIAVPEESVSYLFSVYTFLRSFSVQLFLSPFGLDDFVGALNCTVQNSLLDAIHVSLMRALRWHLLMLSSEGSELASKCLRYQDWDLLDSLTWPAFLVEYLYVMAYMKDLGGKGFGSNLANNEYYGLPVATKLKILQILCDDVIGSAELRTELAMRENMEEEMDSNEVANVPHESGPRRVHPRNAKTSACKNIEALQNSVESSKPIPSSKFRELDEGASDIALDGNSDECRLCGMDGTLICCDGCPSAYHSRCIGLNKQFLPDGLWFCPECTVNKLGPTSARIERGIRGAEIFGIDMYGRVFLGTCNYLLVIGTSLNAEQFSRYYNQDDVTKVLHAICLTGENASTYADICGGISKYWELPLATLHTEKAESVNKPLGDKEPGTCYDLSSTMSIKRATDSLDSLEVENYASNMAESSSVHREILCEKDGRGEARGKSSALDFVEQSKFSDTRKSVVANSDISAKKTLEASDGTLFSLKHEQSASGNTTLAVQKVLPVHISNGSVLTGATYSKGPVSAERSTAPGTAMSGSQNKNQLCREDADSSIFLVKNDFLSVSFEGRNGKHTNREAQRITSDKNSRPPALFKPHAYVNLYVHGDVAASSAANLAVLSSEEGRVSEVHASSNPRKKVAANISLQIKAIAGAAMHFLWPSFERKVMDVPRERCGWCIACKGASTTKKGCLLNLAAGNAIKGSPRSINGLRPLKHDESHFPTIAAYIANMEESLRGLLVGPFLDAVYNQQWRKGLREASSCRAVKTLLLQLEKNIRVIAFTGGWFKLVDDSSVGFSTTLAGTRIGPNQKRGPGRKSKKQSVALEFAHMTSDDSWKYVQWWRGGKLSKAFFQNAMLPSLLIRKAARQGGFRRISDVSYPESELPRRSRQFAWRASVELSKNASQLALQVRYLDAHIRWRDLVRPEQTSVDGKGLDADASVYRNAVICDKRTAENKIIYALTFSNQKHLPLRVTKNILEGENIQAENGKLWFSEYHVPLYLIKEFEEKFDVKPSPSLIMFSSRCLPKFQNRHLKPYHRDIFLYLLHKGEEPSKSSCTSCKLDVFLRDAVKCSACQGNSHKDCTIPLIARKEAGQSSNFMCKLCYHATSAALNINHNGMLKSQLPSQRHDQVVAGTNFRLNVGIHQGVQLVGQAEMQRETKSLLSDLNSRMAEVHRETKSLLSDVNSQHRAKRGGLSRSYGLIWKGKKGGESGHNFRLQNIILKSKEGMHPSRNPICGLCHMPYRSDLMYICCEKCRTWYHADALQLEEAQIFNLIGFKCGRCRRKSSPECPYKDPHYKKPEPEIRGNEIADRGIMSGPSTLEDSSILFSRSKEADSMIVDDDPLLHSFGRVEPIVEYALETEVQLNEPRSASQSHQKLSVRRPQVKFDLEGLNATEFEDPSWATFSDKQAEGNNVMHGTGIIGLSLNHIGKSENVSSPLLEWDFLNSDHGDVAVSNVGSNYQSIDPKGGSLEEMEYEPQTYFSFTELLASEDGEDDNLYDLHMDASEDGFLPRTVDESGTVPQEEPLYNALAPHEVGFVNNYCVTNDPALVAVPCHKCKINEPYPDLTCEICGLQIHSHCSPWVESEEPSGVSKWRCGGCRQWR